MTLLRASGPAAGGFCLSIYGVYGGQYAAKFSPQYVRVASLICIAAMVVGLLIALYRILKTPADAANDEIPHKT